MTSRPSERSLAALERKLGVRFRERELLREAVTHRSYLNEQPDRARISYDRLEYLGDAFLGWVVAGELFARYPGFGEGVLTRARAALVQGPALAAVADSLGLGPHLILGLGEDAGGGRRRPRTLAAALEAVIGAVLVDRGERRARALVLSWLGEQLDAIGPDGPAPDAKSALQEQLQRSGRPLPVYRIAGESGPPHARTFTVRAEVDGETIGEGAGPSKSAAEQNAAQTALQTLRHDA